ncbi:LCP family protein [Demequina capsici]|uniref:LCP family protein n=1 Tax=Demequina capsici TaxID=3075620 RepID=A0AA96FAN9_9MICO|nr:LCP family protein [Demequina sp. PMTSA13]WNM26724.1 LCP family protein [Demequina sp. PMTSA13]
MVAVATFGATIGAASLQRADSLLSSRGRDISAIDGSKDDDTAVAEPASSDDAPADPDASEALNILIVGADVRSGENAALGGYVDGSRADVTIILHISADRSRVEMVSIPRDTIVDIPSCESFDGATSRSSTEKINAAFNKGYSFSETVEEGVACTSRTVTALTGVDFDHQFIAADFAGFKDMVDALDGVEMCIPYDMVSEKAELDLSAGYQRLDGTQALSLARARYGLDDGTDLMRIQRQQELIKAILRKALSINAFTDPGVLTGFVNAAASSLTMSTELGSLSFDLGLLYSIRDLDVDDMTMLTAPWAYDAQGQVHLTSQADSVWQAIIDDTPLSDVGSTNPDNATFEAAGPATIAPDPADDEALKYLPIPPESAYVTAAASQAAVEAACVTG